VCFDSGIVSEENLAAIRKTRWAISDGHAAHPDKLFQAELLKEDWTEVRSE